MKLLTKILIWPFKIIFSRTTLAVLSILLQIIVIGIAVNFFEDNMFVIFGGTVILSLFVVIYILNSKQNPAYKIAWIVPILVFPVFGVLVYLFVHTQVGTKMMNNKLMLLRNETKRYLIQDENVLEDINKEDEQLGTFVNFMNKYSNFPMYTNTDIKYFPLGRDMYEDILLELENAKQYIFLEYFIIERGLMWNNILEILERKVKEGVEVRVLYDGMCEIGKLPKNYDKKLQQMGIKCRVFSPMKPFLSTHQNNRDHRKIAVIDGMVAYTGGINIADEYIDAKQRFGHWKDTAIRLKGSAVQSFTIMFLEMWNVALKNEQENYEKYINKDNGQIANMQQGYVLPYGDNPLDGQQVGRRVYLDMINTSKKYVHIITPYLILDNEMLTTLIYAVQRGVDVKIIMPHIPDKKMVYYLGRSYYKDLIEAGVEIYEYMPGFVHAKMFIADDIKAVVGTMNLDYRSLYLHFECCAYIYKNTVITNIEEDYQYTLEKCEIVTLEQVKNYSTIKKYIGKFLRIFSPLM